MEKEAQATSEIVKLNKTLKGKIKIPGTKTVVKNTKGKLRRNTVSNDDKASASLPNIGSEESKQPSKSKSSVLTNDISRRTQSMSKVNGKIIRKMSDPFSSSK